MTKIFKDGEWLDVGTDNYSELKNKPSINRVELSGNKTAESLGIEDLSNKVTTITSSSTNTQYPSAKSVYDYVNTVIGGAINALY